MNNMYRVMSESDSVDEAVQRVRDTFDNVVNETEEMSELTQRMIAEKKAAFEANGEPATNAEGTYPPNATVCGKCHTKAMVMMDGCETCLACGESKCG